MEAIARIAVVSLSCFAFGAIKLGTGIWYGDGRQVVDAVVLVAFGLVLNSAINKIKNA